MRKPVAKRPAELHARDVVFAPDAEEHWHGATSEDFMSHLSITEGVAQWGDRFTVEEYATANRKGGG